MYTFFIHLNATKEWLGLNHGEREDFVATVLQPIFGESGGIDVSFYDAEAFTSKCSDIAVLKTADLEAYTKLMDDLRDSSFFMKPYFELVDIYPTKLTSYV